MRVFIIQRIDQWGGYVAKPGGKSSYVVRKVDARKFSTMEEAEANCCPENEVVREEWLANTSPRESFLWMIGSRCSVYGWQRGG